MNGLLAVADLSGDPRRRAHDRRMQRLLGSSAFITIIISALILFVLARGSIDFLKSIGWDLGVLRDSSKAPGWFPRRERFDLITIVMGSVLIGLIAMLVAVPAPTRR